MKRAPAVNGQSHQRAPGDKSKEVAAKGDTVVNTAALAGQVESLSLGDENGTDAPAATANHDPASATPAAPATPPREKESSADVASPSM